MRVLTDEERAVIVRLANEIGSEEERNQLLADLVDCAIDEVTRDGAVLKFHIHGYQRSPYRGDLKKRTFTYVKGIGGR